MVKPLYLLAALACTALIVMAVPSMKNAAYAAAPTAQEEKIIAFVSDMSNSGLEFLGNNKLSETQKKKRFKDLLDTHFDIKTIAQFALGIHWRNISDNEKKEYVDLFENMVVNIYARRFGDYKGQEIVVKTANKRGKRDFIVSSTILPPEGENGPEVSLDWRVRNRNGSLKIIDISVEGTSMIITQRADFSAVIQKGNGDIEFLLAELRKSE
jgi:phospholipid transport system substrate-binding protein